MGLFQKIPEYTKNRGVDWHHFLWNFPGCDPGRELSVGETIPEKIRSGHPLLYKRGPVMITVSRGLCIRPVSTNRSRQRIPGRSGACASSARAVCGARSLLGTSAGTATPGQCGDRLLSGLHRSSPDRSGTGSAGPGQCRRSRV